MKRYSSAACWFACAAVWACVGLYGDGPGWLKSMTIFLALLDAALAGIEVGRLLYGKVSA